MRKYFEFFNFVYIHVTSTYKKEGKKYILSLTNYLGTFSVLMHSVENNDSLGQDFDLNYLDFKF